jgi:ribosomal protein S18 acetylase RimI-like enzyme
MISKKRKIVGTTVVFAALLCAAFGGYYYMHHEQGPIYEFNDKRDTKVILELFDKNWHWLIANEGSSPAFYLKHRTPHENPAYFGKLKIKVLRENNEFIGFTAYYMETPHEGRLLFLGVEDKFRGKGYGTILTQYAINELIKLGAEEIGLWTRLSNPAQRIYKKLGFVEAFYTENGFVFYKYYP